MEIIIRHSEKEDVPEIKTILEQPSCYSNTLQLPYQSVATTEKRFGTFTENFHSFVAVAAEKVVGHTGVQTFPMPRRKHAASMGLVVHEEFQNKGIGSKLLETAIDFSVNWLAIRRIEIEVYTDNEVAIALYKKFGFVLEGTAKSFAFRNGVYVDVHQMARVWI